MLASLAKKVRLSSKVNQIDERISTFLTLIVGLSSSLPDQVKQILEVVGTALRSISSARRKQALYDQERATRVVEEQRITKQIQERIRRGVWHDPRMGPIGGGGVIAELGVGDEPFGERDEEFVIHDTEVPTLTSKREGSKTPDLQAPIVVLKNYTTGGKEEVMGVFAKWAATLVEGKVRLLCHLRKKADSKMNHVDCSCHCHKSQPGELETFCERQAYHPLVTLLDH